MQLWLAPHLGCENDNEIAHLVQRYIPYAVLGVCQLAPGVCSSSCQVGARVPVLGYFEYIAKINFPLRPRLCISRDLRSPTLISRARERMNEWCRWDHEGCFDVLVVAHGTTSTKPVVIKGDSLSIQGEPK